MCIMCICLQIKIYFKISKGCINHMNNYISWTAEFFPISLKTKKNRKLSRNFEYAYKRNFYSPYTGLLLDVCLLFNISIYYIFCHVKIFSFYLLSCVHASERLNAQQNVYKRKEWCENFDIDNWKRVIHIKSNEQMSTFEINECG